MDTILESQERRYSPAPLESELERIEEVEELEVRSINNQIYYTDLLRHLMSRGEYISAV